ncbi:hypothetical protein FRB93_007394 [Tulasnella sp. JGI-2019a]|nr:hypothetical protein FRB93_007394 [Tulasnella sp. JGI-2019a]
MTSALPTQHDLTAKLWSPHASTIEQTGTHKFLHRIQCKVPNAELSTYEDLWKWSTENVSDFWNQVWDATEVIGEKADPSKVDAVPREARPTDNPAWFPGAKLNWAENMLRRRDDKIALIQATEPTPSTPNPPYRHITYRELYDLTSRVVDSLKNAGIKPGDRIASYASNCIENVAASLGAAAIGAIWVSVSADFGPDAALSRFQQVQPKVIFSVDSTVYNAKVHTHLPRLASLISSLAKDPTCPKPKVVVVSALGEDCSIHEMWGNSWITWNDFLCEAPKEKKEIEWYRAGFDWPLWILFSSGTTNKPKPIVHRAGGMLLQSKKEFQICADLGEKDVFFYYSTTGWMMWNFLVNGLSTGCTLVLYDGSPLKEPGLLWKMTEDLGITIFGTSAKYLDQLSKEYKPREHHNLSSLRQIYSTGSPLASHLFDYVYRDIKQDVLLSSITGGTDICSLFAGVCTALPVYRGELQCRMLGMAVEAFTSAGVPANPGESGELVCTKPFPCQPLGFWPLPGFGAVQEDVDVAQVRFMQSYFGEFKEAGVWYHGDHVMITPSREGNGGGVVMLGRSDGVLNPGGIRFGSSEIYDVIDSCFSPSQQAHTILDSLVVGQTIEGGVDERVVLFVRLPDGVQLDETLIKAIKTQVRGKRTARHVPACIVQVEDVPYTLNGKKVEVPIKKILNGARLESLNMTTLRNPNCLVEYVRIGEELRNQLSAEATA